MNTTNSALRHRGPHPGIVAIVYTILFNAGPLPGHQFHWRAALSRALGIERDHRKLFSGASEGGYGLRLPAIRRGNTPRHLYGNNG